ncbi:MAG: hypothetical protein WC980_05150 [Candidatus Brocadiia bacterium]
MEEAKKPEQLARSPETCQGCNKEIPEGQASFLNNAAFCRACRDQTITALEAEEATGRDMFTAILGGCAAAIIAGIVWGLIAIWVNYEIGYMAIGVGALTGYGVFWATGKKRGLSLQVIASATSLLGILIGKYISFHHFFRKGVETYLKENEANLTAPINELMSQFSLFSGKIISSFFANISNMVSGYDFLWIILAIWSAYKITAMRKVQFTNTKANINAK